MNWADYFYYNETSPSYLRWAVDVYTGRGYRVLRVSKGDVAGTLHKGIGYWIVNHKGKQTLAHRIVWELHMGSLSDGDEVDHEDGRTTNNRIGNLRKVSTAVNVRNRKMRSTNVSGVTGVSMKVRNVDGIEYWSWVAQWNELDGKRKSKQFSIDKHGDAEAFMLACEHRSLAIQRLNTEGAGYTERHITNTRKGIK